MLHCDNNCTVVSGLAEDFLWEVSGCSCDDAPLKLGGGPLLYRLTGCFRWRAGCRSSLRHTHMQNEEPLGWVMLHVANFYRNIQTQDVMYNSLVLFLTCFTDSMSKVFNVNYISYFLYMYFRAKSISIMMQRTIVLLLDTVLEQQAQSA